ncbi:gag-pol polyprotein [Tanacetum coccineum]
MPTFSLLVVIDFVFGSLSILGAALGDIAGGQIAYYIRRLGLGIVHQTSIARTPQQNGVVEPRNRTLVEATRTMLIFSKALEFLWAEAIATTSPQIVSSSAEQVATEPNSSVLNENANEFIQEDVADFDGNVFYNAPPTSVFEEAESSSTYQDPSNMHEFHQKHRSSDRWTKNHLIEQVISDPSKPEAMLDASWIKSMHDELNQFRRLDVWELVECHIGRNIIAAKWIWKNKTDAENRLSVAVKKMKKPSQAPRGVLVGPKVGFKPVKQVYRHVSKKNNVNTSGNKKKDMEPTIENVESSSTSTTPIVEKIDKIERLIIDGNVTLVNDEGKPLAHVDSSGDHDSEDEVASVDNEMVNFLASKKVGYGTNSLLEQWKETYENDDYDFDPYDDDMYEGQDNPDKIQAICDNLNIKVRGRKKK